MITDINPVLLIDGYKADHRRQYPKGTEYVYSNLTPRMSRVEGVDYVIFFGLQYFIRAYLMERWNRKFFNQPKWLVCADYARTMKNYIGNEAVETSHIEELHDLGYLPVTIKALPEGTKVPIGVPVLTIVNTDPKFFWVTNYLETLLSNVLWKPITAATTAYNFRMEFERHVDKTGYNRDFIDWQGHDFSFRGTGGNEDAIMCDAGHLTSFTGTDTIPVIAFMEDYYYADSDKEMIGGSVPATEHSVMCMGTQNDEIGTFRRLIHELYPTGIVSIVSDTWDFWKVITEYLPALKNEIMNRPGRVVIRPDSGDPVKIICGLPDDDTPRFFTTYSEEDKEKKDEAHDWFCELTDKDEFYMDNIRYKVEGLQDFKEEYGYNSYSQSVGYEYFNEMLGGGAVSVLHVVKEKNLQPEYIRKGAYECLWDIFGGTVNEKGYKELHPSIGLIYGDSITIQRQAEILKRLENKGFSASNLVFGIGSYTYQFVTRDTYGFAMKATWGMVNGKGRDIFKDPKTDSGFKKSARGLLQVYQEGGKLKLKQQCTMTEEAYGFLEVVFEDSKLIKRQTLKEIRKLIKSHGYGNAGTSK